VGGSGNLCLGILGAAQIDPFGNANSTKITDKFYLVGSGGSNDIASSCRETIVVMSADKNRLVPKVPYITYPGKTVRTLITQIGIFEKTDESDAFVLTAYLPSHPDESEEQCVARARENVSWKLNIAPVLNRLLPPSREELTLLRLFDPRGYYIES
jgi:acyl CoA:acetate/3-ketoacid CoA transferase beta subunit